MALVKEIAGKMDRAVGIFIDLQGPEIRLVTPEHMEIALKKGSEIEIRRTKIIQLFR